MYMKVLLAATVLVIVPIGANAQIEERAEARAVEKSPIALNVIAGGVIGGVHGYQSRNQAQAKAVAWSVAGGAGLALVGALVAGRPSEPPLDDIGTLSPEDAALYRQTYSDTLSRRRQRGAILGGVMFGVVSLIVVASMEPDTETRVTLLRLTH